MPTCWKCEEEVESGYIFCSACKAIQPSADIDHFTRLDVEQTFDIGEKILDVTYFAKQRYLHPDLFVKKSDKEKKYSMGHTVDLNNAYETLKSPLKRAEYLLKLEGVIVNQDNSKSVKPSQQMLMESLEMREELEGASDNEQVRSLFVKATDDKMAIIDDIKKQLAESNFDEAAQSTIKLRYLEKFIEEIKKKSMKLAS
jgi:molecular chaperone HscB